MAQTLSKTGIGTSGTITAAQITQSIDALTGVSAFDITISGSLNINNAPLTNLTASGGVDFQGTTNLGIVNIDGATTITSALNINNAPVTNITASGNISSSFTSTGSFGRVSTSTLDLDSIQGNWTNVGNTVADLGAITTVDINGGTINGITDLAVADGGTGVSTLTDGGVLLGSGTGAITAMAVLTDGQMIVGDGSTDPVAESGATLRTSIGVGTTDNVLFANISASGDISASNYTVGGTISGAGFDTLAKEITNTIASRAGGTTNKTLNESQIPNGQVNIIDLSIAGSGGVNATTITLPAVADSVGRHFNLYQQETAESNITLVFTGPSGVLQGMIINSDSNEIIVNRTTITIGVTDSDRGDRYDFFCDGTFWYLTFFRQGVAADTTLS